MKKLVLKQDGHATAPYKVISMENTAEWSVGERLNKKTVQEIVSRVYHSAREAVKVVIK